MTLKTMIRAAALCACAAAVPASAQAAAAMGPDGAACATGNGPAIKVNVSGLKDRTGRLKLELYPATEADFLKDDRDLQAQGKVFRRVWADMPSSGAVSLCIKAPAPGKYALFFTHDRDGKNKFNFWEDGAGVPSNRKLGRSKPKLAMATIAVPSGVTTANITAQYLRGLIPSFGPVD